MSARGTAKTPESMGK